MEEILDLAKHHKLSVIEDCAQAHGAQYRGKSVGSLGEVGAWSFCQDKIMTTGGEGGMVTTQDETLWHKMWSYKDHGKSHKAVYEREHPPGSAGCMNHLEQMLGCWRCRLRLEGFSFSEWHSGMSKGNNTDFNCRRLA